MKRHSKRLKLFVTGDAPRSRRARANLAATLQSLSVSEQVVDEIDLLADPTLALDNGIFAAPALMVEEGAESDVMYGDLSEEDRLKTFVAKSLATDGPGRRE